MMTRISLFMLVAALTGTCINNDVYAQNTTQESVQQLYTQKDLEIDIETLQRKNQELSDFAKHIAPSEAATVEKLSKKLEEQSNKEMQPLLTQFEELRASLVPLAEKIATGITLTAEEEAFVQTTQQAISECERQLQELIMVLQEKYAPLIKQLKQAQIMLMLKLQNSKKALALLQEIERLTEKIQHALNAAS